MPTLVIEHRHCLISRSLKPCFCLSQKCFDITTLLINLVNYIPLCVIYKKFTNVYKHVPINNIFKLNICEFANIIIE